MTVFMRIVPRLMRDEAAHSLRWKRDMTKKVTPKKSEWKPAFLEHLRETANVSSSARSAGVARQVAYKERDNSEAFRGAWDDAIEEGLDYLEGEARRRAYEGTLRPVYQKGEKVGEIREYSDTLTIFLLKGGRPEKYAERVKQEHTGKGGGPIETIEVASVSDGDEEGPSWP